MMISLSLECPRRLAKTERTTIICANATFTFDFFQIWDNMVLYTKSMFQDVQDQVELCRKQKFEIVDLVTDELSTTFNKRYFIELLNFIELCK